MSIGAGLALAGIALAGCSAGGGGGDGSVEISYLVANDPTGVESAERVLAAFEEKYPDISVTLQTQPAGTEGDNLTKTKLATGEMEDVFVYNTGSLFQALNPDQTLVDLSDQSWIGNVTDDFLTTVKTDSGTYGAPIGASFGGGVLYNIPVYEELGLQVPTTWDEFMANSETIKQKLPDVAPVLQAYGETWTSQLFVLASYADIAAEQPDWAEQFTANKVKFADEPGIIGFQYQQDVFDAGLLNEDFPSLTHDQALRMLAEGDAAQYPMLTNAAGAIAQNTPDRLNDVGFFALPAPEADNTAATIWQPAGLFIPKSTEGDELEAAKTLVDFIAASPEACEISQSTGTPTGPYVIDTCPLEGEVPQMVKDVQTYFDSGRTSPALEFLSPVKGPNLENIAIEVGSGITSAADGAAAYDIDVEKQAQQLGLDGW
ncbi:extracellular solute-binding protein (plasmid) [Rathayibacter sp. VKM Ac-2760]|nr:extracellular solute-binding protein [Rathayibacter sp. VKM Ac-2760]